jgi:hypothetical protein
MSRTAAPTLKLKRKHTQAVRIRLRIRAIAATVGETAAECLQDNAEAELVTLTFSAPLTT